jgi:hypothetical protein
MWATITMKANAKSLRGRVHSAGFDWAGYLRNRSGVSPYSGIPATAGLFLIMVDPLKAPIWAIAFLLIGVLLLRRRSKPAAPSSQA